jgi:hypothetical protein
LCLEAMKEESTQLGLEANMEDAWRYASNSTPSF